MPRRVTLQVPDKAAHAYSALPYPTCHAYIRIHYQPNSSPPGLAHWACLQKASALGPDYAGPLPEVMEWNGGGSLWKFEVLVQNSCHGSANRNLENSERR